MKDAGAGIADVLEVVAPLAERFARAGHDFYLVGGLVRDAVLERPLTGDIDVTTDATPDEIVAIGRPLATAVWTQGARFGTIGLRVAGYTIEVTTHRTEAYLPASRKPTVEFSTAVGDDLSRRDFTVNAMAMTVPDGALVDPHGGRDDLDSRILRTPLDPETSFSDDPLRMFRAARFVAGYDLVPDDGLEDAIVAMADRLEIVSVERIADELDKLLAVPTPSRGLALLERTGLLQRVAALRGAHDDVAAVDGTENRDLLRLTVLLRCYSASGEGLDERLVALRSSRDRIRTVRALTAAAAGIEGLPASPPLAAVRRLLADHPAEWSDALAIARLDEATRSGLGDMADAIIGREGLDTLRSPLDGDQVVAAIGHPAGPWVGEALGFLRGRRLDTERFDEQDARRALLRWWESRPG